MRQAVPLSRTAVAAATVAAVLLASCEKKVDTEAYFNNQPQIKAPPELYECAKMVNAYVILQRGYPESDFNVSYDGRDHDEPAYEIFRVSHIESWRGPLTVGGDDYSFFALTDCKGKRVVKELKGQ